LLVWLIGRFVAFFSSCANATKAYIPSTRNNRKTDDLIRPPRIDSCRGADRSSALNCTGSAR
jgi:hypothetical protein